MKIFPSSTNRPIPANDPSGRGLAQIVCQVVVQVVVAIEQSFKLHAFGRVLGISNPKQLSGVGIGCVARHLRQETKLLNE